MKNEDRLSLAQMERLRAELRPNLVFVLELVRRELADTLPPGADLDAELRWLKQALRPDG